MLRELIEDESQQADTRTLEEILTELDDIKNEMARGVQHEAALLVRHLSALRRWAELTKVKE